MARRVLALVAAAMFGVAGCSKDSGSGGGSPTTPTPPPSTQTRVIQLEGDLNFGDVAVGASAEKVIRIVNRGNAALTVTGLNGPGASAMSASWTRGDIPSNQWQDITVRFSPTAAQSYNGTLTVSANHTSGTNTMPVSARGVREPFQRSGVGNTVFDMPTDVRTVRIFGRWDGRSNSNFIVTIGGRLVVNEILRDRNPYEGVHSVNGGRTEITNSSGIAWTFEEVR